MISVNYYAITPGDATPVSQYIDGAVRATTIRSPATSCSPTSSSPSSTRSSYLQYRYFDSDNEVISGPELLGPTINENQYLDQGYLQMAQAQSYATAAALTHLGYRSTSTNAGALVYGIAARVARPPSRCKVAQVITARQRHADDRPTCALVNALHGLTPGTTVDAQRRAVLDQRRRGLRGRAPSCRSRSRWGRRPRGSVDDRLRHAHPEPTAYLGIDPETQQDWHFPVKVTVHTQDIGGPSAGLAMTLGIIDKLSSGRLTGSRIVAATGTIDQYGNVGDVGGVAEKTIAVEQAGADRLLRALGRAQDAPSPRHRPSCTSTPSATSTRCCAS